MTVINLHGGERFDFKQEALTAAINEACAGDDTTCSLTSPCAFCQALATALEHKLRKAFIAGQMSMQGGEDGNE